MTPTATNEMVLEKPCPSCKQVKPLTAFYRNRGMRFDRASFCAPCHRESTAAWKAAHPDRQLEYQRKYQRVHHTEQVEAKRKWREANPDAIARPNNFARFRALEVVRPTWFAAMRRAQYRLQYAVRTGKVQRAKSCEDCGTTVRRIEGAHYDYSRPYDVRWLCRSCHVTWDLSHPKAQRAGGVS